MGREVSVRVLGVAVNVVKDGDSVCIRGGRS